MNPRSYKGFDSWWREHNLRVTDGRRVIAEVVLAARDFPDVNELHRRVGAVSPHISLATLYRTLRLLTKFGIIERHKFQGSQARYGPARSEHQDHLIDINTGRVIEFRSDEIERLQVEMAARLGYRLTGYRLELFGEQVQALNRANSPAGARKMGAIRTRRKDRLPTA